MAASEKLFCRSVPGQTVCCMHAYSICAEELSTTQMVVGFGKQFCSSQGGTCFTQHYLQCCSLASQHHSVLMPALPREYPHCKKGH